MPTYDLLDAQVNAVIEPWNTTLKIGGSNLLENVHIEAYGGPFVGRMLYASLTYEFNHLKEKDSAAKRIQDFTPIAIVQAMKRAGQSFQ